ncbi:MAG: NAD-dependent epimerase/dehydratase family protein [Gaiellaceae bacterium]
MSNRCAMVTGGAGFIGSHVVDALLADDWRVVVVDDLSTGDSKRVADTATLEVVDITDRAALDAVVDAARPEAVFHLAAQASVTRSVADPGRDLEVNVRGTLNVLEGATRHGAPVVFTSTGGALFGNGATLPASEDTPPAPISPYGASKWAAEAYVTTWREASGAPHAVCRLANVYGPRQNPHGEAGVVAIFSHQLSHGETPTLFGFGKPTRDYVHVQDVARAHLAALGRPGVYNVSTGVETPVSRLWELLRAAAEVAVEPELAPLREGELERSCLDSGRAREQLGWQAEIGLEEGLAATYRALVDEFGDPR